MTQATIKTQEAEPRRLKTAEDHWFDPQDPATVHNPGPAYSELAAKCPFYRYEGQEFQYYITSDYKEIREQILSDNPNWSFKWGDGPRDWEHFSDFGILTDPPFHFDYMTALRKGMAPSQLKAYRPRVEQIADELLDDMTSASTKQGNFHDLFALPLPARVICMLLGSDETMYPEYKKWGDALVASLTGSADGAEDEQMKGLFPYFQGLIDQHKQILCDAGIDAPTFENWGRELPANYISLGLVSKVNGRSLNDEELFQICTTMITAGQETTVALITNAIWRLLEAPERWERFKAEPQLAENIMEESLRYDPPISAHFRTSLCPVTMHGEAMPERSKIMFSMHGANRDPTIFEDPDTFVMDRPLNQSRRHISFGYGVHFCLGAPLARMEALVALRKLAERLPNLRLIGERKRIDNWMYNGLKDLPVAWD